MGWFREIQFHALLLLFADESPQTAPQMGKHPVLQIRDEVVRDRAADDLARDDDDGQDQFTSYVDCLDIHCSPFHWSVDQHPSRLHARPVVIGGVSRGGL